MGKYIELTYDRVAAFTGRAILLVMDNVEKWIPVSVIHTEDLHVVTDRDNFTVSGTVRVKEWFAEKDELI